MYSPGSIGSPRGPGKPLGALASPNAGGLGMSGTPGAALEQPGVALERHWSPPGGPGASLGRPWDVPGAPSGEPPWIEELCLQTLRSRELRGGVKPPLLKHSTDSDEDSLQAELVHLRVAAPQGGWGAGMRPG